MTRKKLIKKVRYLFFKLGVPSCDARTIGYCRDLPERYTNEERWQMIMSATEEAERIRKKYEE
jgi:hypothetical protein